MTNQSLSIAGKKCLEERIFVIFRSSKATIFRRYPGTKEVPKFTRGYPKIIREFSRISENEPQSSKYDLTTFQIRIKE